ncbi:MAG: ATP-dependent DNA helicase RecG [Pseudomonadales bacterium]|nr:ATP-dependent DNA helicase RecG [Pseudomonadales bacterium]
MIETLDQTNIQTLKGIGPALATKLARIGIITLQDVLFHLPLRYEDRTKLTPIHAAQPGTNIVIQGKVVSCDLVFGRRRSLLAKIQDSSGTIALRFFHFSKAQQNILLNAPVVRCIGEVRRGSAGFEIYHPEYSTKLKALDKTLTPIYPVTEGINQTRFRSLVNAVITLMDDGKVLQNLGAQYPELNKFDINSALRLVHHPTPDIAIDALLDGNHPAQQRLCFEELLAHHTSMRLLRQKCLKLLAPQFCPPGTAYETTRKNLGFKLTNAQARVAAEINLDMQKPSPMLRLLQGDVGSGKTVIALLASTHAAENNYQTAIMAPTEILAEQHYINFSNWLRPLGITTGWLTGKIKGKKRQAQIDQIKHGEVAVVIGTHALFQKEVNFSNLGLMIIDEQHKFGVEQRLALRQKGESDGRLPHQLVMTATPIPRTLTMSIYADMDCSIIDELPPGRSPITTSVLSDIRREEVIQHIELACQNKAQAYWVCTLIEESETLQCQAAESTAEQLGSLLPSLNIGLIHGRMKATEKSAVMQSFKQGKIDLLVATTVIEVGVDVPNASLMVIENPERLGLAQLHQLRGRIGRGSNKSFCILLYHPPLSDISRQRLQVMRQTQDGFLIAEKDLEIRGPGDLLGTRQSGSLQFRLADLLRDSHMLPKIRTLADHMLKNDKTTAYAIMNRWLSSAEALSLI